MCGATYADLYALANSTAADYMLALSSTLLREAASPAMTAEWSWVDALFMAMPTWTRYGVVLEDPALVDTMHATWNVTAHGIGGRGLWSPEHGLFYRDATFFNKTTPNGSPVFWARGNGWAIVALARSIAALPAGHPYAAEFTAVYVAMAAALAAVQGADGMWRSSLLDAGEYPNPETTGTAMFTAGIAWGVRAGVLPAATYTPVVAAAWAGLQTISLQPSGLVGWCQPADGQPHAATQTDTSDFCVGQFLLAGAETVQLFA